MNLYLVRHSDAQRYASGIKDQDRKLTPEGILKTKLMASKWYNFIPSLDYIISSPYTRAQETAKIIFDILKPNNPIILDNALISGSKTEDVITLVNSIDAENIMLVGHQPDMAEHISVLTTPQNTLEVEFKKTSIAKISFGEKVKKGIGVLEFLVPPYVL
ncbi:MAG: phosphohistidine phosphatase SixA [Syntrophothermus sp.]